MFRDPGSPFFKALSVIEVASLEREYFIAFLDARFRSGRRRVPDSSYDQIFELAEENPSDIQQLCSEAGETIGPEQLQRALDRILATEGKGYEALIRPLTDVQMRCLRGLARFGGDQPQCKRFLDGSGSD